MVWISLCHGERTVGIMPHKSPFFDHLKDDVDDQSAKSLKELVSKINHYMVYYTNYRYQWNLKKMIPIQYRNHLLAT